MKWRFHLGKKSKQEVRFNGEEEILKEIRKRGAVMGRDRHREIMYRLAESLDREDEECLNKEDAQDDSTTL